ncbi:MAG: ribosome biogenesis GTP-binding protein YihA/YsxC [Candidatus Methylomirabilales bacterium]
MKVTSAEFTGSATDPRDFPRDRRPEIAFAGRSNVGKSSMLNRLLGRRRLAHVSRTPGRTQTINFYRVNEAFYFVDLPGYGYAKVSERVRRSWAPMVEGYLRAREVLRAVVMIVDARHPPTPLDQEMRAWLYASRIPHMAVLTKVDKVNRGARHRSREVTATALGIRDPEQVLLFSAVTGEGERELWQYLAHYLHKSGPAAH